MDYNDYTLFGYAKNCIIYNLEAKKMDSYDYTLFGLPHEDTRVCEICEVHECGQVEEINDILICEPCCKRLEGLGATVRLVV